MRTNKEILDQLLNNRGIISDEDIEEYLSDKPQKTYDPFLLHDMKEGVDLLLSEINKGSRICVYGDYDADGVTSVCIIMKGLRLLTDNLFYYIPSRFKEGYGLNRSAIDKVKADGADLILTVDCGCVAYEEVEYAKKLGLKVIVTDHHTINDVVADCIVINPKHPESVYPFKELAGCGVAYKLLQALQRTAGLPRSILSETLDMVAIGTIGDIVSLRDENRTLVKYGIKYLNGNRSIQFRLLAEAISINAIDSGNIAFGIVPRINAAGRMKSASDAVELFRSEDFGEIREKVDWLVECNKTRKKLQDTAYEKCLDKISGDEPFILLKVEGIHEGIAGIVAGKIKEQFNRPAVIVTPTEDGMLKGTGRSIDSVNLYDVLSSCSELFERFGGHKGACGFLMKEENFDALRISANEYVNNLIKENDKLFDKTIEYDITLTPGEITVELAKELKKIEPCGEGNPDPVFKLQGVKIVQPSFMGEKKNHVRFSVCENNEYVNCVLFNKAKDFEDILLSGDRVNIIGAINLQTWRGREQVQFRVEEIEICR